jgi:hypothetical protein
MNVGSSACAVNSDHDVLVRRFWIGNLFMHTRRLHLTVLFVSDGEYQEYESRASLYGSCWFHKVPTLLR